MNFGDDPYSSLPISIFGRNNIVRCYGISQNPTTENYIMVMDYVEEGNLREFLKNKNNELSFKNKLYKLGNIASGLQNIHFRGLVHRDFHPGNILGDKITDL